MMRLRNLILFVLFLPWGARRSTRIVDSDHDRQEQGQTLANGHEVSAETREAFIPTGSWVRGFHRAPPQAVIPRYNYKQVGRHAGHLESHRAAPLLRVGSLLMADTGFNADQLQSEELVDKDENEGLQEKNAADESKLEANTGPNSDQLPSEEAADKEENEGLQEAIADDRAKLQADTDTNADQLSSKEASGKDEREKVQGAIAALEAKLITARGRLSTARSDLKDVGENGYLLVAADFERYKRKAEAEMSSQQQYGKVNTLRGLLPFVERLDFLQSGEGSSEAAAIDSFYAGIHSDVQRLLRDWKVTPLAVAAGQKLDYTLHRAVDKVVSEEVPTGVIIEVREQGWKVEDKILREASVVVSSGPPKPPPADEEKPGEATAVSSETEVDAADQAAEATAESAANIDNNVSEANKAGRVGDPRMAIETSQWTRRLRQDGGRSRRWQMQRWRARPPVASESKHAEEGVDETTSDTDGPEAVATEEGVDETTRDMDEPEAVATEVVVDETTSDTDESEAAATEKKEAKSLDGGDLLSSMSFLKAKLKVLENELLEVEEQTETAKASAEEVSKEWTQQRKRLELDVENYKRRHIARKEEAQLDARINVLKGFLSVLDNFDRARACVSPDGEAQETRNAMYEQMHADLMAALGELGLEKVETVGAEFDYNLHNVIQQVPSDEYDSGVVVLEMQAGYTCKGKLVRAAYVAVAL